MRTFATAVIATLLLAAPLAAAEPTRIPEAALARAESLRAQALADGTAWRVIESLTTEVGPRLAGSEADARAVAWAKAKFAELGYERIWTEPVTFPKWERRHEAARVVGAHAQPLAVTALGGSPAGIVEGEVVRFDSLAALEAAAPGSLAGKLAFIDLPMPRGRDGHGYGLVSQARYGGPSAAIRAGAIGFLLRSAGTGSHRHPHTGGTHFAPGLAPIPAAALALPDADQLARLTALGPTRVRLELDCGWNGEYTSENVIAEIAGSGDGDEMVVIGGHLDSWDLGTGAIDDGAGIGITMAAGHLIGRLPRTERPARRIRVIAFANEEGGLLGGRAYAEAHHEAVRTHLIGAESDLGAGRIYAFATKVPEHAREAAAQLAAALAPLGIEYRPDTDGCGPDLYPIHGHGMGCAALQQDATRYFDVQHSAADTLDAIDREELAQNVAAYTLFAFLAAAAEGDFGSAPQTPPPSPW
jgi:hypothetical protein